MKIWKELWHYSDRSICKTQYRSVPTTQYWIRLVDCPSLHTQFKNDPSSRWSVTNFDPHLTVWPCQFLFSSEKSRDSRKSSPCTIQHQYVYSCLSIQSETELGGVSGSIGGLWRGGGGVRKKIFSSYSMIKKAPYRTLWIFSSLSKSLLVLSLDPCSWLSDVCQPILKYIQSHGI